MACMSSVLYHTLLCNTVNSGYRILLPKAKPLDPDNLHLCIPSPSYAGKCHMCRQLVTTLSTRIPTTSLSTYHCTFWAVVLIVLALLEHLTHAILPVTAHELLLGQQTDVHPIFQVSLHNRDVNKQCFRDHDPNPICQCICGTANLKNAVDDIDLATSRRQHPFHT